MPNLVENEEFVHNNLRSSSGLFQQKRNQTAPGSLNDELWKSGREHSVFETKYERTRPWDEYTCSHKFEEREIASFEDKVAEYNGKVAQVFKLTRIQGSKFEEVEGAVRFYVNDEKRKLSKAIRMRNTDTVASVLPVIRDKFNLSDGTSSKRLEIVHVSDKERTILKDDDKPLQIAVNIGYTPRFVIQVRHITNSDRHPKSDVKLPLDNRLQYIGRQNALTSSTRCSHRNDLPGSGHSVPEHLCSHHSTRKSLKSVRSNNSSRGKAFQRSKSEGRSGIVRSFDDSQDSDDMSRSTARKGSRQQQTFADKENGDFQTPAAKIIESRRRKKRDRSLDEKALERRSGSLRSSRSKSVSNIFQKTFSLRKKENPMIPRTELSTEDTPPGVLRIFGPAISPGTQYKSVLASSNSSAEEIVKEALDRYSISREYARHFVLCDVIGQFIAPQGSYGNEGKFIEGIWQEECIRIIGDNERPLILQSFWKPSEGFSRRFELRNRGEFVAVENFEYRPYANNENKQNEAAPAHASNENVASDSSSNPPKKIKNSHAPKQPSQDMESSISSASDLAQIQENMREIINNETDFDMSHQSSSYRDLKQSDTGSTLQSTQKSKVHHSASLGASVTGADSSNISRMTNDIPFIMTLRAFEPEKDTLVHFLSKDTTIIGCDMLKLGSDDICLPANDILSLHCRVHKDQTVHCSVEPFQGALVKINNRPILQCTQVLPGDIISLGNYYIFMFRNPTIEKNFDQNNFALVKLLHGGSLESDPRFYYPGEPPSTPVNDLNKESNKPSTPVNTESKNVCDWRKQKLDEYESDNRRLKLTYKQKKEDELLQRILSIMEWHSNLYKLSPSYLLSMCVEYSAVKFEQVHTRQLLLKIASRVQSTVLDRTKLLAECQTDINTHPAEAIEELLPDIQAVVMWLSNSLEILHFLQTRMREYLLEPAVSLPAETRMSIAGAEDEVVTVLEDVVMYTFQQTVYYITKTLYTALPAILESNPFNEEDSGSDRSGMDTLLSIFQTTLHTLLEYNAHPQILSQLFCYLFFFTDTSLINTLMTNDGAVRYYKWSSGARLRGNLDSVEAWACDNHLQDEAAGYLKKLNNLVDLLATPKVQLQQADWSTLRAEYNHLSPAQLHNVLSKYNVGSRKQRPQHWLPTDEDLDQANDEEALLESFNNHPALVLPDKGFSLDLCRDVTDPKFHKVVKELLELFGEESKDRPPQPNTSECLSEEEYSRELSMAARYSPHIPTSPRTPTSPCTPTSPRTPTSPHFPIPPHFPTNPHVRNSPLVPNSPHVVPNSSHVSNSAHDPTSSHIPTSPHHRTSTGRPGVPPPPPPPLPPSSPPAQPPSSPPAKPPKSVPWYQQNSSPTEAKSSVWTSGKGGGKDVVRLKDSGFGSYDLDNSQEHPTHGKQREYNLENSQESVIHDTQREYDMNLSQEIQSQDTHKVRIDGHSHQLTDGDNIHHMGPQNRDTHVSDTVFHSRDNSNRSASSDGRSSSRNSTNGSREKLSKREKESQRHHKKTPSKQSQYRFVYDFEENFMTLPEDTISLDDNQNTTKSLNTNTGPVMVSTQNTDQHNRVEDEDPLYMNIKDFEEKEKHSMTFSKSIPGLQLPQTKDRTFTSDPIAMSTPVELNDSSTNASPNDGAKRQTYIPISTRSKFAPPPTMPKPVNRVSQIKNQPDNKFVSPSDENVVEVQQSALSPRSTISGLRVLPLTTDDQEKKQSHDRPQNRLTGSNPRVTESEMDQILHNKSRQENSKIIRALESGSHRDDDIFIVDLSKNQRGLGLGLIDGLYTPHRQPGIYVRTLIPGGSASEDGRIELGDRILAVNNENIVGADYQSAMNLIKNGGSRVKFLVAKSDRKTAMQITASSC